MGRRVICTLVAILCRGWLLTVVWRHILGAIGGRVVWTQHRKVALMGHLTLPQIWPLAPPQSWHLALPRSRHLALARLGQWEPVILRLTIKSTWIGSKPGEGFIRHSRPRAIESLMTLSGLLLSHMTR
jgi:hypothetical protein